MHTKKLMALVLLMMTVVLSFVGMSFAKYIQRVELDATVTFQTELAEAVLLVESKANLQDDGSYELDTDDKVNGNAYTVMPGVDILKDPRIIITNKTAVPAYLYIEIVSSHPDTVTYTLKTDWTLLNDVTGVNGGKVYVYQNSTIITNENCPDYVDIIQDNLLYVSDTYDSDLSSFEISIYAYMAQVVNHLNASDTFNNTFITGGGLS